VDYRDVNSARAYAYRTASNVAIEMIRVRRRRATHWPRIVREYVDEPMPHPAGESPDDVDADSKPGFESALSSQAPGELTRLREALALLPAHLQHVIVLRDLTGMSYEKVGACLGIEPTTARVYRRHAVVKLAELLDVRGADHERDNQGP
jgi:RNA polymerase sigma factor (sigma-70 family)